MKNVNRIFPLFLTASLLLCGSLAFGQERTLQTGSDGFRWYELRQDGYYGAQSINGTTLIPLSRKYTDMYYVTTHGGWFCFRKNNSSTYEGCCDKNGREVIGVERRYNKVYYWKDDGYIEVKKNGLYGACDLNGREIIAPKYESLILNDISGEFEYENSQGDWVSTGVKYAGKTVTYASSSSSSSSNNSSSSSNSASGNTKSGLLYEGDYTEGNWVNQYNGWVLTSLDPNQHFEIYEDYLSGSSILGVASYDGKTSSGKRKYVLESLYSITYYVDDNFNITAVADMSGQRYNISYRKGNASYNINAFGINPYQSPDAGYINNGGSYTGGYIPSSPTTAPTTQSSQIKCSYCHGTGRVAKNTYPPMYGATDYKVRCPECGEEHLKSAGHVHVTCPNCHGRGYIE
ncbi:MAG: WG repeat-containing protein [Bacteroidia bacterium]|nr:WG repeat-containing protein [Bacteroidia bacterium]